MRVGTEEITTVISDQGTMAVDEGLQTAIELADTATPLVLDRPAEAGMIIDQGTGMIGAAVAATAAGVGYEVELQPSPVVQPSIDPNDAGVDIVTPNQAHIRLTGAQDTTMIIRNSGMDAVAAARQYGSSEIGVIQTTVNGTRVIVMDDVSRVASSAQYTADAVRNGVMDNASIDACVTAEGGNGNRIVIGVPRGTIGSGSGGQCSGAPVSVNTGMPGLPSLPGIPQLPGIGLPGLSWLSNLPGLPQLPGAGLPQVPGVSLPQLPVQLPVQLPL